MGRTDTGGAAPLFADAPGGTGARSGAVWGCYLHALLENDAARAAVLAPHRARKGLKTPPPVAYGRLLEASLDALAAAVRKDVDMEAVHGLL
jgi:cobyric acid synthase